MKSKKANKINDIKHLGRNSSPEGPRFKSWPRYQKIQGESQRCGSPSFLSRIGRIPFPPLTSPEIRSVHRLSKYPLAAGVPSRPGGSWVAGRVCIADAAVRQSRIMLHSMASEYKYDYRLLTHRSLSLRSWSPTPEGSECDQMRSSTSFTLSVHTLIPHW